MARSGLKRSSCAAGALNGADGLLIALSEVPERRPVPLEPHSPAHHRHVDTPMSRLAPLDAPTELLVFEARGRALAAADDLMVWVPLANWHGQRSLVCPHATTMRHYLVFEASS